MGDFASGGECGAWFDEHDRGCSGRKIFRGGETGGGCGREHPAGAGDARQGLAELILFNDCNLIGKLLEGLGGNAGGCAVAGVQWRSDVDGNAARSVRSGGPVVLKEEAEGLLEVEQVRGRCAGDEEGFGEFPVHLLGDFACDGVGGEAGSEGDIFGGERAMGRGVLAGCEQGSSRGGGAEMVEMTDVGAEHD